MRSRSLPVATVFGSIALVRVPARLAVRRAIMATTSRMVRIMPAIITMRIIAIRVITAAGYAVIGVAQFPAMSGGVPVVTAVIYVPVRTVGVVHVG